jgi:3-phenylpropionate/cinnamic acid dioxygenase small subunit
VVIDRIDGNTAHVRSKWVTVRSDGTVGTGVYVDQLVRTDRGWRIAAREAQPGM